jgi:pyruvate formate lyase activating enzyme
MRKNGELTAYIHSVETAGMVDGPGIRYTIFFHGCALRCKYCHNPDTWKLAGGLEMTVEELLKDVMLYRSFMRFSGGGVTVTGGDPFMQPEFLIELLKALKSEGIHTALDTAGYTSSSNAEKALDKTDLLLLDIKSIDPKVYRDITGLGIDATLRTLDVAYSKGIETWIRFVLIPGLTDNFDHIRQMRDYLKRYDNISKIEVLPFHKMGEYKWAELGIEYELADTQPPNAETLATAKDILEIC